MPRFLVQVESHEWGQGKTSTVRQVANWLQTDANLSVGGFSLRRNYFRGPNGRRELAGYNAYLYSTHELLEIARPDRPEWFHNDPTDHRSDAPEGRRVFHVNLEAVAALMEHCRQDLEDPLITVMVFDEMGLILSRRPYHKRPRPHIVQEVLEDVIQSDKQLAIVVYSDLRLKDRHVTTTKWREESNALGAARLHLDFVITRNNFRTLSSYISSKLKEEIPELQKVPTLADPA